MIEIDKRRCICKKVQTFILGLLLILWFFVISSYSFQPAELSTSESKPIAVAGVKALKATVKAVSKVEPDISYLVIHWLVRKMAHFICFAILGFSCTMLAINLEERRCLAVVATVFLYGLCAAITDEVSQFFVPARTASLTDVFVDFTGVCMGYIFFRVIFNYVSAGSDTSERIVKA